MGSSQRARRCFSVGAGLLGLVAALILPGIGQTAVVPNGASAKLLTRRSQAGGALEPQHWETLDKLYAQFSAGAPFSEEEADIRSRFARGVELIALEVEVVSSRALYDYYVRNRELTRDQQDLFDRYSVLASRRPTDVLDLKTRLLNQRIATIAASGPQVPLAPPTNDQCSGAEVIPVAGPFPYLTASTDITEATTTGDPPLPSCQASVAFSIWFTFTPSQTGVYEISSCQDAPTATTAPDTVVAIYTGLCGGMLTEIPSSGETDGCDDDTCGNQALQADITTELSSGTQYFIVVFQFGDVPPAAGQSNVQLRVSPFTAPANDTCAGAIALNLDTPVNSRTTLAVNNFQLSGAACFAGGIGQIAATVPGPDVVYRFIASAAGSYSFRVTNYTGSNDLVLYTASSCPSGTPPQTVTSCLAAANRSTAISSNSTSEEVMCQSLTTGQQIFVIVDENIAGSGSGTFTLEVNRCHGETEPNGTPATANTLLLGKEGSINPAGDADFFNLGTPALNSRVFALVDGIAGNLAGGGISSPDFDLRVTTTTDTLEYDDLDNDVGFGSLSPNVAGTRLTGAQSFLRLSHFSASTAAEPYRLYAVVQPPGAGAGNSSATAETEPNNTIAQASVAVNNFFSGNLSGGAPSTDLDLFRFAANTGDLIFLSLDCDPLRNNTPMNGALELLDSAGKTLLHVNDSGSTSITTLSPGTLTGTTPISPGEGLVWRATATGNYYAKVFIGTASTGTVGAGDYLLSISKAVGPTAVNFSDTNAAKAVRARRFEDGVLIQWQTSAEIDNLGFNIYREISGRRSRINPQLIAGSALVAGPNVTLTAGKSYVWLDRERPLLGSVTYWLEDIDLNGIGAWTGPIVVKAKKGRSPTTVEQSALISRLGMAQSQASLNQVTVPVERRARVEASTPDTVQAQSSIANGSAVKLSVTREAWYRIPQPDLVAAGLDARSDPRLLQMFVDGKQIAIAVTGELDGRFDATDSVEFFGLGLDDAASDAHVYWLVAGAQSGMRIKSTNTHGGFVSPPSFQTAVERRDRTIYFGALRNGEVENFFGPVVASTPVSQSLTLTNVASAIHGMATLDILLQGVSVSNHEVKVTLNGLDVGTVHFAGQTQGKAQILLPQEILRSGENAVHLTAIGGGSDISLVDTIRITYWHSYRADANVLRLDSKGGQQITIDGFTSPVIRVMDISDPNNVQELTGVIKRTKTASSITVSVPGEGSRSLLAFTRDRTMSVHATANLPSSWRREGLSADLVIITHREFTLTMEALKSLRERQGLSVAIVDVDDIYDEFSFGNKNPQAIKDLLRFAQTSWRVTPRFVLLAGDASYDPKNYLGNGDTDLVPTKLIDTQHMEAASDDWFVDLDGDYLPEMAVARLPARTTMEATSMIAKIVAYEMAPSVAESVLIASDRDDGFDFESLTDRLRQHIPEEIKTYAVRRSGAEDATVKAELISAINEGQKLVNYYGHGSANSWRGNILTNEDALALANGGRLSVFVLMTCLNGYFDDPSADSLAESLMKAGDGGAISVWASSAMCDPSPQRALNESFYREMFGGGRLTIGEAAQRAKMAVGDDDVRRTWILFGDPSMTLK